MSKEEYYPDEGLQPLSKNRVDWKTISGHYYGGILTKKWEDVRQIAWKTKLQEFRDTRRGGEEWMNLYWDPELAVLSPMQFGANQINKAWYHMSQKANTNKFLI